MKQLLANASVIINPPPENIIQFYSEYQNTFGEIEDFVSGIQFVQGIPDSMLDSIDREKRNLYTIDYMIGEKDTFIAKLFTKISHHGNLSVIYIVQNLFHQSKNHTTISLDASYLVLTKNVRDACQVVHLAKQLYPSNTKFFQQAYQMAKRETYAYLFVDLTQTRLDEIRLRSGMFPTDKHYVYQPRVKNHVSLECMFI